jgi:Tfp pilus assembly protein PilO
VNRRAPLIAGVVFIVLSILVVVFVLMPKITEIGEAEERLQEAEEQELVLETELSRLREAAEEAEDVRRELAEFRRSVPPVADLPGLINQLQTAADISGVDFFAISPGDPVPTTDGRASQIPASIEVIGSFFPVDEFLSRLESLPRAAKVTTIDVTVGATAVEGTETSAGSSVCQANCLDVTLATLFYTTDLDAGPGAPVPAAPGTEETITEGETATTPEASPAPGETPAATTETP